MEIGIALILIGLAVDLLGAGILSISSIVRLKEAQENATSSRTLRGGSKQVASTMRTTKNTLIGASVLFAGFVIQFFGNLIIHWEEIT